MATNTTTTRMFLATTTLLLLLLSSLPSNAQLPSPSDNTAAAAPSPGGQDCMTALLNMSDCLSYVMTGSNLTKPDKPCCPELAGLVKSSPGCLCQLVGNPGASGFDIDVKRAIKLPQVCKVITPPVSLCAAIGVPVAGVPTSSPPAAAGSSSSTEAPSPVNTFTVPSPSDSTAAAAPSPGGLDCMTALLNMSDCLSYVMTGSNLTKPDKPCCPELAGLVESSPVCLCQLVGNPGGSGFDIDVKRAIKLPQVCKVITPPVSLCAAMGVPVAGVPTSSPAAAGSSSSTEAPSPSLSPQALASSPASITRDSGYGVKSTQASLLCLLTVLSIPFFF